MSERTFPFRFTPSYRTFGLLFGVTPATAIVTLTDRSLNARFGPWRATSDLSNIDDVQITGPYGFLKTAGPAHLSSADRGLTMATNGQRGVCLSFRKPIHGLEPTGRIRHPNLTVTVVDCDGLAEALLRRHT